MKVLADALASLPDNVLAAIVCAALGLACLFASLALGARWR